VPTPEIQNNHPPNSHNIQTPKYDNLNIVAAHCLRKEYGGQPVVNDISLQIRRGEFCGILGPNGAGKTSTLRMLTGNLYPSSGQLHVLGYPVPECGREMRALVGIVPQTDNLDPDLNVAENLFLYGRYFGLRPNDLKHRIPELLDFALLSDRADCRVNELSGGMKRRLTIARALINSPKLLILDEPTTGLDPQVRHTVWEQLRQLHQTGITLILTTHYMEEAERLCDRIVIMDQGQILADQTPQKLICEQIEQHVLEVHGFGVANWLNSLDLPNQVRIEQIGETVFFYGSNLQFLVESLDCSTSFRYLYRQANLEDVFLKLTGRELRDL